MLHRITALVGNQEMTKFWQPRKGICTRENEKGCEKNEDIKGGTGERQKRTGIE